MSLPCYEIEVELDEPDEDGGFNSGSITSMLTAGRDEYPENDPWLTCMDVIESMVLAHAVAGIDIMSPAYIEGIETAVDASNEWYGA